MAVVWRFTPESSPWALIQSRQHLAGANKWETSFKLHSTQHYGQQVLKAPARLPGATATMPIRYSWTVMVWLVGHFNIKATGSDVSISVTVPWCIKMR